ncbi:hypothetical protein LJC31_08215 [Synergistaceae bacterium OttesenSCG-928-I11]|nr:hypothetical protein [Synergistaceae bacterium OttesenSCG-928-I11]
MVSKFLECLNNWKSSKRNSFFSGVTKKRSLRFIKLLKSIDHINLIRHITGFNFYEYGDKLDEKGSPVEDENGNLIEDEYIQNALLYFNNGGSCIHIGYWKDKFYLYLSKHNVNFEGTWEYIYNELKKVYIYKYNPNNDLIYFKHPSEGDDLNEWRTK